MVIPAQKMARIVPERPHIKPSSPVCRRLFSFPDPSETKRMVEHLFDSERQRLKNLWGFDFSIKNSAGNEPSDAREASIPAPTSPKVPRYQWKLQDPEKVPHFYTRPCRPHHSEARNLNSAPVPKNSPRIQKLFCETKPRTSPLPLSCRDENASPVKSASMIARRPLSRKVPSFASPPKISSSNFNPSVVRLVTALRVPLPTSPQITAPTQNAPMSEDTVQRQDVAQSQSEQMVPCEAAEAITSTTNDNENTVMDMQTTLPSKRPASRQLFAARQCSKRTRKEQPLKQRKITEMVQQRKLRSTTKRTNQSLVTNTTTTRPITTQQSE
ncbi:uncharacterized protein LOC143465600 [Clavelina lepadiformis]|uniref:uncharacterized protein LOC143465600 n=1 Tax=Clavelina lepadiformis TaxID=159417 RepID=UPI004040F4B4